MLATLYMTTGCSMVHSAFPQNVTDMDDFVAFITLLQYLLPFLWRHFLLFKAHPGGRVVYKLRYGGKYMKKRQKTEKTCKKKEVQGKILGKFVKITWFLEQ